MVKRKHERHTREFKERAVALAKGSDKTLPAVAASLGVPTGTLFASGHLPRPKLDAVLERAEENGRQHILLYAPSDAATTAKLNDFKAIESALLEGQT
jgi:hypothetical protein